MRVYPDQTVDAEFQTLGSAGYVGTLNDRQYSFLVDWGLSGALSDMLYAWRTARFSSYSIQGFAPGFIADFVNEKYKVSSGTFPSTFADTLTFSRASSATMVDSTGTLVTVGVDEPRIGHHIWDGSAWVDAGYLHESEARTNLITASTPNNTDWSIASQASFTTGALVQNGITFSKLVPTSASSVLHYRQIPVASAAEERVFSAFVVLEDGSAIDKLTVFPGSTGTFSHFDMGALTTTAEANVTENGIIEWADGVYLIYARWPATETQERARIYASSGTLGSSSTTENGTDGIYIAEVQVEASATFSSRIPTNGATATRAAETLTAPSANLPWPTPQVIGDELVTNGTFDTDTSGWSAQAATVSWNAGALSSNASAYAQGAYQSISTTVGKTYVVKAASTSATTLHRLRVNAGSFAGAILVESSDVSSPTAFSLTFTATSTTTTVYLRNGASGTVLWDNISVREINPLAVSIQMEGTETFADEGTAEQVLLYDRRVDANNRITLSLDTDSTKVGTLTLTMVNGGSSTTISTTAELTPGVNDPFNVAFVCTSNELGIALDGTAETRVSHVIGLPDLSGADAVFGGMGTRAVVREWAVDITDAGLAEAST